MLSWKSVAPHAGCEARPLQASGAAVPGAESPGLASRVPGVHHALRIGGNFSPGLGVRERDPEPWGPVLPPQERSSRPLGLLTFLKPLLRPAACAKVRPGWQARPALWGS